MKIYLEKHNPEWKSNFESVKNNLIGLIGSLNPVIAHIGSTSVEGLSAKPIIDILVGLSEEKQLEGVIQPLTGDGYVYYERYNEDMPYRRLFVKHKVDPKKLLLPSVIRTEDEIPKSTTEHNQRLAHVHILTYNSEHWVRHIAFRDYLRKNPGIKDEYQRLKEQLSLMEWEDGNDYNAAKSTFIKTEEQKAIKWYLGQ
jgi:GrpB-like predicted nucleotidyltransferase (UPF0157 family)